ncbi:MULTISPECIES: hypothetical protein [Sphingobium]|uniref:Uncharacterized protein n=1 Tax=Sphingobium tyrosinilyticum TaxID=2715436 RepID=A0ABV9F069_9SPHN|nr:hypothetical protein [Sphingobium sp. EP60837]ANI79583.1 hypothetical protein EP837_03197 [Sphingobium sp. EP60837]
MISETDSAIRAFNVMVEQIEKGQPFHPQEVQDVINELLEEGHHSLADRLSRMKIKWGR